MMKNPVILVICAGLLASCGSIKPDTPALPVSRLSVAPQPDSKIDIPVSVDVTQLFNEFNASVPKNFTGQGTEGPAEYRWKIQRQPFTMRLSGDSLDISDAAICNGGGYVKNPLNGNWSSVCGCDVNVDFGIRAGFTLASNYSITGTARLVQFDMGACNLTIFNTDVSPLLKPRAMASISDALRGLNQELKQYNLRGYLAPAWSSLYQPIKVGDYGYLVMNPSAIRISRPVGAGNQLKFTAGITAKPVFSLADPGKITGTGVPDLSSSGNGSGFNLNLDVHLEYEPLNKLLKSAVENQQIPAGTKGYIIIEDAGIYGVGNSHLLIKVKFSGKYGVAPYHGILYFTCLPVYDVNTGNFSIADVNFDTNTIHKLKEGPAVWILSSTIKRHLQDDAHFNIGGQISSLKTQLNQALNRPLNPRVTLSGQVDSLKLQGILPQNDYILVRVNASGNLAASVH